MLRAGEDCRWSSETAVSALSGVPLEAEQRPQRTMAATVADPGKRRRKERARARGVAHAATPASSANR